MFLTRSLLCVIVAERGGMRKWNFDCTKSGVDVAEDSGWLHMDGMDVSHSLHIYTILQQQLLNLLRLGQN